MNLFICSCKIVMTPRLYLYNNKAFVKICISTLNNKKGYITYIIHAKSKGKLGLKIFDLYRRGDFILIQGSLSIKNKKIKFKNKKIIILNIKQIHPVQICFK